ncbi:MAG: formate dehydrogenase accessory sulfurtransferase FdhD, partial [Erysipelotrichaceae bacterium]
RLVEEAELYKQSGGVHGCAIKTKDKGFCLREDIGRHNAVDKAIGVMRMNGYELTDAVIASTGRISLDMILKAVAVNAPIITSLSVQRAL